MSDDLQARVASLPWHHSIDLGGGVVTPGGKSLQVCQTEEQLIFDRLNIAGRSVLDIGAWNGVFSFAAKRRGAARVLATDSYCWAHPHIKGRETFELARSVLNLEVESKEIDVTELNSGEYGSFDVVLYLGVFYHRYDAIEALSKASRMAKDLLIVETHLDLREVDRPAMVFYPGAELANDPTNWWGPNERCVIDLLAGLGFTTVEVTAHPAGTNRAIFHAWRSLDMRTKQLPNEWKLLPVREYEEKQFAKRHPVLARIRRLFSSPH